MDKIQFSKIQFSNFLVVQLLATGKSSNRQRWTNPRFFENPVFLTSLSLVFRSWFLERVPLLKIMLIENNLDMIQELTAGHSCLTQ